MINKIDLNHAIKRATKDDAHARLFVSSLLNGCKITKLTQNNFTIVNLSSALDILGTGVSKRSPADNDNETIGYNLALVRAVKNAVDNFRKLDEAGNK